MSELRRVSKHFSGIATVDDVSFSARPGEVTGYLGPNGSGKSTTMKVITGLLERTFCKILFQGKPIQGDLIAYKRRMGYVPEEPYLYNHLSGAEYLAMIAQLRNLPAPEELPSTKIPYSAITPHLLTPYNSWTPQTAPQEIQPAPR